MGYSLHAFEYELKDYPLICAFINCGKSLPPPYKRPFWLRGSDLCARHAMFKKRSAEISREGQLYLEEWSERERSAAAEVREPEFVYLKDSLFGRTRKFRAKSLTAAPANLRSIRFKIN